MAVDPELVADAPYAPGGFLIDDVLEVNEDEALVRVLMPTHEELPLTSEQRAHPERHPRHVSGGLMVHMTGMAAFVHAYYLGGMRHREGWIGYGVRIHDARFNKLASPGQPLEITCKALRERQVGDKKFSRYAFTFTQDGETVYQSEQSAMWMRTASE